VKSGGLHHSPGKSLPGRKDVALKRFFQKTGKAETEWRIRRKAPRLGGSQKLPERALGLERFGISTTTARAIRRKDLETVNVHKILAGGKACNESRGGGGENGGDLQNSRTKGGHTICYPGGVFLRGP